MSKHTRDPKRITDMIFVKRLERRLGRALTEFELEDNDEAVAFYFPDGHIEQISIPRLRFPHDVITTVNDSCIQRDGTMLARNDQGYYETSPRTLQLADQDKRDAA